MKAIVKLYLINSNENLIDLSRIKIDNIKDFGNGFFISKNGHIASVAHVLKNCEVNPFILNENNIFQKVKIIERILNERDENHLDIAIGKIETNLNIDYFDTNEFEEISENINLILKGYRRENQLFEPTFKQIKSYCFEKDYYNSNRICMKNLFSFVVKNHELNGLSGCPIFNDNNKIVGFFKGGANIEGSKTVICSAIKSFLIKDLYRKYV